MLDCVDINVFSENTRKRLSVFFFGVGVDHYPWNVIASTYLSLVEKLGPYSYDWVRGPASDILADINTEDEEVLKKWIAEHPLPL